MNIICNFQWSFGVTCWEIFSLGRQPYGGVDNYEMTKYLSEGHRLEQPTLCSDEMLVVSKFCPLRGSKTQLVPYLL